MRGTWQVTDYGGVKAGSVLGAIAAAGLLSWLAAVLWILAVTGFVLLALLITALILLRRWNHAGDEASAARTAEFRAAVRQRAAPQVTAPPPVVVNHYHGGTHLHITPGTDTAGIIPQAIPGQAGDAITPEKE